ncbi:MAG: DUF6387 family protein [Gammaproteobacteria bacterium]|nr:DUF6387 family protein [Gammaproteobacteria bacterium]
MKRIKHVSELPDWFKLEKYEFTKNIKSVGWYEQLYARTIIVHDAEEVSESLSDQFVEFKLAVEAIQENPNIDITSDKRLSDQIPLGGVLHQLKPKRPHYMLGIHSISLRDYVTELRCIDKNKLKFALDWFHSKDNKPLDSELPKWMNEPLWKTRVDISNGLVDTLSIFLALPDELLLANFKQYLAHARKRGLTPLLKPFTNNDFKNWAELQILAYIDLSLWAKLNNVSIPCRVIADAIFPNGDKGEETVRKTVKPLVKNLLHYDTWNQLGFQAGVEIQEEYANRISEK